MDAKSLVGLAQYWWCGSHPEEGGLSAFPSSERPERACASRLEAAMPVTGPVLGPALSRRAGLRTTPGSHCDGRNSSFVGQHMLGEIPGRGHPAPPQLLAAQTLPSTIRDVVDTGQDHS